MRVNSRSQSSPHESTTRTYYLMPELITLRGDPVQLPFVFLVFASPFAEGAIVKQLRAGVGIV